MKFMDDAQRKRLAEKSGDSNSSRPPKYVVPLIRFDGNRGEYRIIRKNKEGESVEEDIKAPLSFVILKKRRLLSSFSPTQSMFTNEHNNTNDKLMLFKVVGKNVSLEATGFTGELRDKYQTLKTHEVVYVLYKDEVCKMEIKGGSLSGYYDYQKELQSEEKHSFEVNTIIGAEKTKNEQGFVFYRMTFDFTPSDVDFDIIEEKLDEVSKACKESDDYTSLKMNEKRTGSTGTTVARTVSEEDAKIDREFNEVATGKSDSINPDDIPF